jgi:dihydroorotate dehydrogenase
MRLRTLLLCLSLLGILDASYLTYEHFSAALPPCSTGFFSDCGKVLTSEYSLIFNIPLSLIGIFYYSSLAFLLGSAFFTKRKHIHVALLFLTTFGFFSSLYFVYLQIFIIGAICVYCMVSAFLSTFLFVGIQYAFCFERKYIATFLIHTMYRKILKPILFLQNPEIVHHKMTLFGEILGCIPPLQWPLSFFISYKNPCLSQKLAGIDFQNPIGLAAGFDYEAKLTQTLHSVGFGFQSIGTITNHAYEGNPGPMLGRLPKSKSLMVNKGFKNSGARHIANKLSGKYFKIPVGVSIGKTNTLQLKIITQSVDDICSAFRVFENSSMHHSFYELNISCPNLKGKISFYSKRNLHYLLKRIDTLKLSRPLFIKMPIEKSNSETLEMLSVISKHSPVGVIIGNLQKNRSHPAFDKKEVAQFPVGNFSGKPCFERSNELISLCHTHFKNRFIIVGCGGVFSAEDAYEKIKCGASLVQLITGMIYEGPQLIAQINLKLPELLAKDGFINIREAVGGNHSK